MLQQEKIAMQPWINGTQDWFCEAWILLLLEKLLLQDHEVENKDKMMWIQKLMSALSQPKHKRITLASFAC